MLFRSPELIGRLPIIAALEPLTEDAMVNILTEPKNALVRQYVKLFEMEGVQLSFDDEALRAIAQKAMKKGTGARALRSIMEEAMLDFMYEVPNMDKAKEIRITAEIIDKGAHCLLDKLTASGREKAVVEPAKDKKVKKAKALDKESA